jgi:3-hydroxy acid dehydrogenase / malonic semialdehyde reductase
MDKTYALITGASSGIGEACAEALAREKRNLILVARRLERLESLKKKFEKENGISVLIYGVDLTIIQNIEDLFFSIKDLPVDVLVNNAGLAAGRANIEHYDWDDINVMVDTNIKAFTRVAQLSIPFLRKTQGHIINISSLAGIEAYEGGSAYCATKAYVRMISKALRLDLAGSDIRVTDIAPGAVDTEFSTVRFKGNKDAAKEVYKGYTPLYAADIAETVVFVLSRPKSVNIESILIMPTAQASATKFSRKS